MFKEKVNVLKRRTENSKAMKVIMVICYLVMFFVLTEMFYRESINYDGMYHSDLLAHIEFSSAINFRYSIMFSIFYALKQINGTTFYIGMFIAAAATLTIYFTQRILKELLPDMSGYAGLFFAFALNLVSNIYVPYINTMLYLGVGSASVWHNATYIFMKFGISIFILFLVLFLKEYPERISVKYWIGCSASLLLTTLFKPNYILCFAPALFVFLVVSVIKNKFKNFKKCFIFALIVIPSMLILLYMYSAVYGSAASSYEGMGTGLSESSIAIGLSPLFSMQSIPGIFQLSAFPLFVFIFSFKRVAKSKLCIITILTYIFGVLENTFLYETGKRMTAGDWSWGYCSTVFVCFVVACAVYVETIRDKTKSKVFRMFFGIIGGVLLLLHTYWGLIRFYYSVTGRDYI